MVIHTTEFREPGFSKTPEKFNAIDMSNGVSIFNRMIDSVVLHVADINQAIISFPVVRMDNIVK